MLHTAVLRSPYARARVTSIDLEPARSSPGVRAVIGPADLDQLTDEPAYVGHSIAAVAADTFGQAQAAVERIAIEWEVLEPLLDPARAEPFVSDGQRARRFRTQAASDGMSRVSDPGRGAQPMRRIKPSVTGGRWDREYST
jgi:xanthine dehydrogenase molybdopterin-binding subunit B